MNLGKIHMVMNLTGKFLMISGPAVLVYFMGAMDGMEAEKRAQAAAEKNKK